MKLVQLVLLVSLVLWPGLVTILLLSLVALTVIVMTTTLVVVLSLVLLRSALTTWHHGHLGEAWHGHGACTGICHCLYLLLVVGVHGSHLVGVH